MSEIPQNIAAGLVPQDFRGIGHALAVVSTSTRGFGVGRALPGASSPGYLDVKVHGAPPLCIRSQMLDSLSRITFTESRLGEASCGPWSSGGS